MLVTLVSYGWCRIHPVKHDPLYFGRKPRNRFDAPAKEFGVLYVAKSVLKNEASVPVGAP